MRRQLLILAAGGVIAILVLVVLLGEGQRAHVRSGPHAAPPAATDRDAFEPDAAEDPPSTTTIAAASSRPARLDDLRWWLYAVRQTERAIALAEDYTLREAGTAEDLAAVRACADSVLGPSGYALAVELDGRRASLQPVELAMSSGDVLEASMAATAVALDLRVRDHGTQTGVAALLVDAKGRPLGPVGPRTKLALPAGFHGAVLAPGYLPAALEWHDGGVLLVSLRRAATVTGRLVGTPIPPGARLVFHDLGPARLRTAPAVADVREDGAFALGPLAAGRHRLRFDGKGAWLVKDARHRVLAPGRQDLGLLPLERLWALHLQVFRAGRPAEGVVWVRTWFDGVQPPPNLGGRSQRLARAGKLQLDEVRGETLQLDVWTDDGWSAELHDVRASETSAERPLVVALRAPGRLVVQAGVAPHRLPDGCQVLVHAHRYQLDRGRWLPDQAQDLAVRLRNAPVPAHGRVEIPSVWAGRVGVALVASHGTVLARQELEMAPGSTAVVALGPSEPLARLEVAAGGERRTRFAVLSRTRGVVLRAAVESAAPRAVLLPAGTYRVVELARDAGDASAVEVVLGSGDSRRVSL